ncbi:uncharacterized protein LOC141704624 [Apium graveolens]|uniref:uncharacterized protein LOC141704624 n=1 Tax=Apium graveolens TaxID=4045 RepID=UPI003D7A540D
MRILHQQKQVSVLAVCPVCGMQDETTMHALVQCPFANQCWQTAFPSLQTRREDNFFDWLEYVVEQLRASKSAEAAIICWAIWKARNDKVWRNVNSSVNVVVSSALQYLMQWKNAQSRDYKAVSQSIREGDGAVFWVKPQGETIKGVGIVARDSAGELVQAKSRLYQGNVAPELAEIIAIKEALSWVKERAWNMVVIESDCLVAVQAIRSAVTMISPFGRNVEVCRSLLREVKTISLSFIKRSANEAAHYVARESYSFPDRVLDRRNVPIKLLCILQADLAI